MRLKELILF